MIELNDDNDPQLFAVTLPSGRLILQYMEVGAILNALAGGNAPTQEQVVRAVREGARTKDVAASATEAELFAAFERVARRVQQQGNG